MDTLEINSEIDEVIKLVPFFSQIFSEHKLESTKKLLDELVFNYEINLKRESLLLGIKEISGDKYIDNSIKNWSEKLFNRFAFYSFGKAFCQLINEKHKSTNKNYNNSLIEDFVFIKQIWELFNQGIENFNSFTANSTNQKIANSKKIDFPEKLMGPHKNSVIDFEKNLNSGVESQKQIEKNKNSLMRKLGVKIPPSDINEEEVKKDILNLQELIISCDINVIEKKIFSGILNDFAITKIINGKQSESYKVKLLWKLFIHSHPHLFYEKKLQNDTINDELNRINLLKLIR